MLQSEYLELAKELYDIYSAHNIHHRRWLTARELQRLKGGPGSVSYTHQGSDIMNKDLLYKPKESSKGGEDNASI